MLVCDNCRSSSWKEKMDWRWGRARTSWNPQAQTRSLVASHCLQSWWCRCPAGEAGTLHHGVKHRVAQGSESWGRLRRKVGQVQSWQVPHTKEVSQQQRNNLCELRKHRPPISEIKNKMPAVSLIMKVFHINISWGPPLTWNIREMKIWEIQPIGQHYKATTLT